MDNTNNESKKIDMERKSYRKLRKVGLVIIDIFAIIVSYYLTQVFLTNSLWNFNSNDIVSIVNSIILSILVYEVFLNLFDVSKILQCMKAVKNILPMDLHV